jgi:hypothetical protein
MDANYGKYNFATTLVHEIICEAIRRGRTSANLSSGRDRSKLRWITDPDREIQDAQSLYFFRPRDPRALMAFAYLKMRPPVQRPHSA